jgi:gliding motility-associated-like protein
LKVIKLNVKKNLWQKTNRLRSEWKNSNRYSHCYHHSSPQVKCADSICDNLVYKLYYSLYVPNAFTPDKDDLNEVFFAKGMNLTEFNMMIFDRWGNKVFESNDMDRGWDGQMNNKEAAQGTYVWRIDCRDVQKKQHQYIGHVTVLR